MVNINSGSKEHILKILKKSRKAVSGTVLGLEAGISRVAVWKNIQKLKDENYSIETVPGGYILSEHDSSDTLLKWDYPERKGKIHIYTELDSTMTRAEELAGQGALHMTVTAAERQLAGKGRKNSVWESKPGGLYFTLILRPDVPLHKYHLFTLAAAAAVCSFLEQHAVKGICRWPNEVYAEGEKIAGILTKVCGQPEFIDYILLGIGVNINNTVKGISLSRITGNKLPLNTAFKQLLSKIEKNINLPLVKIPELWIKHAETGSSQKITSRITGKITGVTDDGNLLIKISGRPAGKTQSVTIYPGE